MANSSAAKADSSRRTLLTSAGVAASLAGAGLAWWFGQTPLDGEGASSRQSDIAALAVLWSLKLATPTGENLALSSLKGKPSLINFWATWCPPCIEELPLIDAFYRENRKNGWQVLGLAVDQLAAVTSFLNKMPIAFPVVLAGAAGIEISKSLGNLSGGLPFTVVLSSSGNVVQRKIGLVTSQDLTAWAKLT